MGLKVGRGNRVLFEASGFRLLWITVWDIICSGLEV